MSESNKNESESTQAATTVPVGPGSNQNSAQSAPSSVVEAMQSPMGPTQIPTQVYISPNILKITFFPFTFFVCVEGMEGGKEKRRPLSYFRWGLELFVPLADPLAHIMHPSFLSGNHTELKGSICPLNIESLLVSENECT